MYLSYFGIRARNLRATVQFYTENFGLTVVSGAGWENRPDTEPGMVLLRDPVSGQRLEVNYYPVGNPYAVQYSPGEELDHLSFRVDDLPATLRRLAAHGVQPEAMKHYDGPYLETPEYRCAYVRDPNGIQLELFDTEAGRTTVPYSADKY
jgi:catechol 2,3-dioxygenase-like lactoylglutathione lyase family enzyme